MEPVTTKTNPQVTGKRVTAVLTAEDMPSGKIVEFIEAVEELANEFGAKQTVSVHSKAG